MAKARNTESIKAKDAINAAIDLFHRRWVLRIIWELRGAALTFRQLQEACSEVSPSVLNQRLAELRQAELVIHVTGEGDQLSEHGKSLLTAMRPMLKWAIAWQEASKGKTPRPRASAKMAVGAGAGR